MTDRPDRTARAAHAGAALAFLACASVQLNDPDPLQWIAVYSAAAGVALTVTLGRPRGAASAAVAAVAGGWALTLLPAFVADGALVTGELGRELGGLALVGGWSAGTWAWCRRRALRGGRDRAKERH